MIQCFTKHDRIPIFDPNKMPRLLSASYIQTDYAEFTRILHKHDDRFELLFVCDGNTSYIVDNHPYEVKKGDMIICNSGVLHDEVIEKSNGFSSYSLAIDNLQIAGLPPNHLIPNGDLPVIQSGRYCDFFSQTMNTIFQFLTSDVEGIENPCHYLMMSILTTLVLLTRENQNPSRIEPIDEASLSKRVCDYIDAHYTEDLSLQILSGNFFVSQYYLAHIFKKETGYSPMQYILRRRIGEAQSLLITTKISITDIALRVGFGNPNNFNIQFTKYVGVSPRNYRNMYTK